MADLIKTYIDDLNRAYSTGKATEHSHRPALKTFLDAAIDGVQAINEPKHIDCGAPDYIVTRKDIPIGYVEAKDIGKDLNHKDFKGQFDRYKQSLNNLIITDYIDFHRYVKGEFVDSVRVAEAKGNKITPIKANFGHFEQFIKDFGQARPQGITSPAEIARMMAGKARLMTELIKNTLESGDAGGTLSEMMAAFKEILIHDITPDVFADIYSQTIAYGLFAARLRDESPDTFCRQKAADLIPQTTPFLRKLFQNIAGFDPDDHIRWIVDDLSDSFRAANLSELKKTFGARGAQNDPIIHFYEDFLSEYDKDLRKSRGVWYTPQAAVNFIVRAVDDILQTDFNMPDGLADNSKIKATKAVNFHTDTPDLKHDAELHKVQILDPAAGTGTFLAETVKLIHSKFKNNAGMWQNYVKEHLIPRLNGFEMLMAPYTMAHICVDWLLAQTGFIPEKDHRLHIYLTNSLEKDPPRQHKAALAQFLINEANEASAIKGYTPVMVVLGNPPYSGESQNKGAWIEDFMKDYKKEPSGGKLEEKCSKWLNDDYVKFIRYGQYLIENNRKDKSGDSETGEGILAFINNHSFIDNPTFRGMRYRLLKAFDKIYILDLHGNAKKKEACPDGGKDENIFNIQQGVCVNIFVKTGKKADADGELAEVFHFDMYGSRGEKFDFLLKNGVGTVRWKKVELAGPQYFFVPKDFSFMDEYRKGFGVQELFSVNSVGIVTARDNFTIHDSVQAVENTINEFIRLDIETARNRFDLGKDARDWSVAGAKEDLTPKPDFNNIVEINYRPFDKRYTYYTGNSKGFHCMPRGNVMQHFLSGDNVGLMVCRQQKIYGFYHCLVHEHIVESSLVSNKTSEIGYSFPLYLYPKSANGLPNEPRKPNLDEAIVTEISQRTGLRYVKEAEAIATKKSFAPLDVLDYVYAVLHSPAYRERYKEFLKIDFPRIPYPESAEQFWNLSALGGSLRRLHLMEGVTPPDNVANFPDVGPDRIEKVQYEEGEGKDRDTGKVSINAKQYFRNVPRAAWVFYIGGYQPAQKWLKDRKGRVLSYDETLHYRRIITVLVKTIEIMEEIRNIWTI